MSLEISHHPLPYADRLESRLADTINLVVIHCTELPDLAVAREWGEKEIYPETRTGNSGHYYIDRDGHVEEWVPATRIAHHVRYFNSRSIGIELVNSGRYPDWFHSSHQQMSEPYPEEQIRALSKLLIHLQTVLPGLRKIAGHEDLDTNMVASRDRPEVMIRRKLDPGPHFPWPIIMDNIPLKKVTAIDL